MASNIITIELSEDDRDRLDRLADMLEQLGALQPPKTDFKRMNLPPISEEQKEAIFFDKPEPTPAVEEPEPRKYTAAEIQLKVQKLAAPASGKRDAVRQIVKDYADRVSEIPEDKFAEVMERLTALEEGRA